MFVLVVKKKKRLGWPVLRGGRSSRDQMGEVVHDLKTM